MNQRTVVNAPLLGLNDGVGHGIVVRQAVLVFPLGRGELIARSKVQRETGVYLPVILEVQEMHPLAIVQDDFIVQAVA